MMLKKNNLKLVLRRLGGNQFTVYSACCPNIAGVASSTLATLVTISRSDNG